MPTVQISGDPKRGGIPRNSKVRIEALPNKTVVFKGKVTESITMNFDKGKYIYSVTKFTDEHQDDLSYVDSFLVGMTDEQFNRLKMMKPKVLKPFLSSEGVRYRCTYIGCDGEYTSRISAVLHEAEHQGINLLKNPEKSPEAAEKTQEYIDQSKQESFVRAAAKPRRGRPPKRVTKAG